MENPAVGLWKEYNLLKLEPVLDKLLSLIFS